MSQCKALTHNWTRCTNNVGNHADHCEYHNNILTVLYRDYKAAAKSNKVDVMKEELRKRITHVIYGFAQEFIDDGHLYHIYLLAAKIKRLDELPRCDLPNEFTRTFPNHPIISLIEDLNNISEADLQIRKNQTKYRQVADRYRYTKHLCDYISTFIKELPTYILKLLYGDQTVVELRTHNDKVIAKLLGTGNEHELTKETDICTVFKKENILIDKLMIENVCYKLPLIGQLATIKAAKIDIRKTMICTFVDRSYSYFQSWTGNTITCFRQDGTRKHINLLSIALIYKQIS